MLRSAPIRVDIPGTAARLIASPQQLFVLVIERSDHVQGRVLHTRRLHALDWDGRTQWSCTLGHGDGDLSLDDEGIVWIAGSHALVGVDTRGETVARVEAPIERCERVAAFVPLADDFVIAVEGRDGQRGPYGRVLRASAIGAARWQCDLVPGPLAHEGVVEMRADNGWRAQPSPPWRPKTWVCNRHVPLAVAGPAILAGFTEMPRSGIGQRYLLDLATGALLWTSPPGPIDLAAIAGPGEFLVGWQGYGAFATSLVNASGVVRSWRTHGHYLVTTTGIRAVEMDNSRGDRLTTATLHPDGTVTRGPVLPGYYTGGPLALADGSIFLWRGGALLHVDARGRITHSHPFGDPKGHASRMVTDGRGRVACFIHGADRDCLWIFATDLPGLAPGPWPSDARDGRNLPVLT